MRRRLMIGRGNWRGLRLVGSRVIARGIASALQAAMLLLIAREAGPATFGLFAVTLSVGYLVSAVAGVGASVRVLRISAEDEPASLATSLFLARVVGSVVTFAATLSVGFFLGFTWPIFAAAALASSDLMVDFVQAQMAGRGHVNMSSVLVVFQRAVLAAGVGMSYAINRFGFQAIVIFSAVVFVVSITYSIRVSERPASFRQLARSSVGYWASSLVANLKQLELVVISAVLGSAASGLYAIASRLTNPLLILTTALQTVFVPELARRSGTPGFERSFRQLLLGSSIYGVFLVVASPVVAALAVAFLGPQYAPARVLIVVMVASTGLSAVSQAYQCKFIAAGKPGISAAIIGTATVVGLILLAVVGLLGGVGSLWLVPPITQTLLLATMIVAGRTHKFDQIVEASPTASVAEARE